MAGIGEASAIVGVLQVGFSLATALNTYISDVSDARDDISSLVSDIEATLSQLRDLGKLIEKNETTNAWSEDGLRNAKKCVTDCEKIITKLRKLLKKSTASATMEVNRDEIDLSKLERALWPFIKPQMEVRRRELQSIKQDIMIAYSSYMTQIGTDAERKKFTDDLPRLQRTRALARRQVREAKERRRRQASSRLRKPRPRPSAYVLPTEKSPWSNEDVSWPGWNNEDTAHQAYPPVESLSDDVRGSVPEDKGPLYFNDHDDLERYFEEWKAEEEGLKAEEEAEKKMIREEAVREYKDEQMHEVEVRRQKIEGERSSLRAELKTHGVAPQQIEDIIKHVHPQEQVINDLRLLNLTPASDKASIFAFADSPAKATHTRRWSIWSKKSSTSDQLSSTASTLVNEPRGTTIPEILRDPTAEKGIAPLEAIYFQRSLAVPPVVENFNVEIPDRWLLDSLIKRQEDVAHEPKRVNSVWKEFSRLPDDYRHTIGRYINDKIEYGPDAVTWVLLHLECMFEKRRRSIFSQGTRQEVLGVYVVLKKNKKPRDRSTESEDSEKKYAPMLFINSDDSPRDYPRPTRRSNSYDYPTQYRPRKSPYEPQGSSVGRNSKTTRSDTIMSNQSDAQSRQRLSYASNIINNDISTDYYLYPESKSKSVSFSEASSKYPNALHPAPYNVFLRPSEPRFAQPSYPGVPKVPLRPEYGDVSYGTGPVPAWLPSSPRRSRSRSRSPRPIRRSGTDESYRSNDSLSYPTPTFYATRGLVSPAPRYVPTARLSNVKELIENSDVSISSDSDDDGLPRRPRRQPRETDEELLQKTLNDYVNPSGPSPRNLDLGKPVLTTGDAARSTGEPSTGALRTRDRTSTAQTQPTVENGHGVET